MGKRILLVEDEPATQLLLKRILTHINAKFWVRTVSSAEEAFRVLRDAKDWERSFDLVIADLNLPSSDGLVLWKIARKQFPGLNFIFVSGTSYEDWWRRIAPLDSTPRFLRKPITEEALKSTLFER
jgi:DNA-binding response OmpR family regulator